MTRLTKIEGIGPAYARKFKGAAITTVEQLLAGGASKKGRKALAEQTGFSTSVILKWVNHADLFRVKGIGGEYAELLEAAGVDTVPELAQRNSTNLQQKMADLNAEKNLVRRIPSIGQVTDWVAQAKALPRAITH